MANPYMNSVSDINPYSLLIQPYFESKNNFETGLRGLAKALKCNADSYLNYHSPPPTILQNIKHLAAGVALSIPLVNSAALIGLRHFYTRKVPPLSVIDTIKIENGRFVSAHGTGTLFFDDEILKVHPVIKKIPINTAQKKLETANIGIFAEYTENGKAIIQQQATRGCTAGATAMLITDNGGQVDIHELISRNLGFKETQIQDLQKAGFEAVVTDNLDKSNHLKRIVALANLIAENGSAIVGIDGELGGHVIVVDEIACKLNTVRLRDPYHGWEITVTAEAFLKRYRGDYVIQIKQPINSFLPNRS